MINTIYEYKKLGAKAEYHSQMEQLARQQIKKIPCTDLKEKQRLYQAAYYHGKRYRKCIAEAHAVLDRRVVKNHA